jgi:hypothetical protein
MDENPSKDPEAEPSQNPGNTPEETQDKYLEKTTDEYTEKHTDPDQGTHGTIRWRADSDKLGKDWLAPVTPAVHAELERLRRERPGVGEALLFPGPNTPAMPLAVGIASK